MRAIVHSVPFSMLSDVCNIRVRQRTLGLFDADDGSAIQTHDAASPLMALRLFTTRFLRDVSASVATPSELQFELNGER